MKKRIYCITTALCLVLCIVLCIAFAAVCSKAENSKAVLPEVRNNGTAIQWRDTAEEEWHDLVALNTLRGTDGKNGTGETNPFFFRIIIIRSLFVQKPQRCLRQNIAI